jgi:hypothetical protein
VRKSSKNFKSPVTKLLLGWLVAGLCISFFNGRYPVYVAPDIFLTLWLPLALLSMEKVEAKFFEKKSLS